MVRALLKITGCQVLTPRVVIPGAAKLKHGIRAPTARQVMELVPRVLNCFKAGALSTGCEYDISISHVYLDLQPCNKLEEFYQEHCQSRWGSEGYVVSERSSISASTDFVSVTEGGSRVLLIMLL
jgi:metal-dependent amidase/aminoacylase/carboxypeptidase family protein